ncbi:ferredoxin [Streptacidiphilus sp. 4-A2]|nr:ferredoxin [Streptacidiphilus sp. 4-A2]
MKLLLDPTRCQGYGLCQEAAATLIDLDEFGYASVRSRELQPTDLAAASDAVGRCPNTALRLGK